MYTKTVIDGYYKKTVTYDARLEYCPYGSAGVVFPDGGGVVLVSYTTPVCGIDANGMAWCRGTYSATTRKHIGAFCKEYGKGILDYYTMKALAANREKLDMATGELVPMA